jgi:hypothetical protein
MNQDCGEERNRRRTIEVLHGRYEPFEKKQRSSFMLRLTIFAWLVFSLSSMPLYAEQPTCVMDMAEAIRNNNFDASQPICPEDATPWRIKLHENPIGRMTDGTALGVLHMPRPDFIPAGDWPRPIVLIPRSEHVWYVGYMYKGEVLPEIVEHRQFLWTPGDSRNARELDNVN